MQCHEDGRQYRVGAWLVVLTRTLQDPLRVPSPLSTHFQTMLDQVIPLEPDSVC